MTPRGIQRLVKDLLLLAVVVMVVIIIALAPAQSQTFNRQTDNLLWGGTTGVASGANQSFIDLVNSLTNTFEVVSSGTAAATLTTTIVGCMPGGTCSSTLGSSSGVGSQIITPTAAGPFQTYKVTLSWTGGDATTAFRINRIGVMAKAGGSGSGTIAANNGAVNTVAGYVSAGGSVTVSPFAGLTYSVPTLTVSVAGSGNGVLALSGNTSGIATITAPATAGTNTNPFVISNIITVPVGAQNTPAYGFAGSSSGIYLTGSDFVFQDGANNVAGINSNGYQVTSGRGIGFSNNATSPTNTTDAMFWRQATGLVSVGAQTAQSETSFLRSANTCAVTADIVLTVNVASNICSFSLPALAKAWAFQCDVQWVITAGTGTNNFAIAVNPSQTPTGTTNGIAQVYTATAGTQTYGGAAISASGATTLLTGATYTPAATVQLAKAYGTLLASASAGTFAITGTANGTTATASIKAGSFCQLN